MEQDFLLESILSENRQLVRGTAEQSLTFTSRFQESIDNLTRKEAGRIPPQPVVEIVEEEGASGHLPQPAKHVVVKEVLAGQRPSPLRLHEERELTGEVERVVDTQTLHVVAEVSPVLSADRENLAALRNAVLSLRQLVAAKNRRISPEGDVMPSVRVKKTKAMLHLLTKSVLADTPVLTTVPIETMEDVQKALEIIQLSAADVLQFHPQQKPNDPLLTFEIFRERISAIMMVDESLRNIVVSVVVMGRDFSSSDDFSRLVRYSTSIPFVYVRSGELPKVAKFHSGWMLKEGYE